jgi:dGTP triphosphohydrolase
MSEKQWKLNEDMHQHDCIFDPITFEQVITAVHHNAKVIDEGAVYRVIADILDSRMQDFEYLIKNNMNEIIAEAKKGRN